MIGTNVEVVIMFGNRLPCGRLLWRRLSLRWADEELPKLRSGSKRKDRSDKESERQAWVSLHNSRSWRAGKLARKLSMDVACVWEIRRLKVPKNVYLKLRKAGKLG